MPTPEKTRPTTIAGSMDKKLFFGVAIFKPHHDGKQTKMGKRIDGIILIIIDFGNLHKRQVMTVEHRHEGKVFFAVMDYIGMF